MTKAFSLELPVYRDTNGADKTLGDTIEDPIDYAATVEEEVFGDQLACAVQKAVDELPERQRKAVEEHYLCGQTYNEIADQLHCSCSYVGQLVKSGLRRIREGKHAPGLRVMYGERNFYRGTGLAAFKRTGYSAPEWEIVRLEEIYN